MISCYCLPFVMENIWVGHGPLGPPGESGLAPSYDLHKLSDTQSMTDFKNLQA